jgi:hypothetical protein
MITLAIYKKHICTNPALMRSTWNLEVGSLWQCDECGREQILVERGFKVDVWRYTVEIVDKRVQKARGKASAKN